MQLPSFGERVVTLVRKNQMIEHIDADNLPGIGQPGGEHDVVGARPRVARWVVVEQHDGGSAAGNRFAEYFTRMCDRRVERTAGDQLDLQQSMLRVQHDDAELLDGMRPVLRQQV